MVQGQTPDFVQGYKDLAQELLVLLLQGQRKPVDDAAQDLQQFADPIEVFRLVDEPDEARKVWLSNL